MKNLGMIITSAVCGVVVGALGITIMYISTGTISRENALNNINRAYDITGKKEVKQKEEPTKTTNPIGFI